MSTVAAVIILIFFCVYTGSCFVTCGKLFNTLFGMDYTVMMIFGAIIVFLYTFMGGYLSVCTTDLVQGTLMFLALATVFIGSRTPPRSSPTSPATSLWCRRPRPRSMPTACST